MKKLSIIFIAIILFTLTACSANKNKLYDITREITAYDSVIILPEKENYSSEDTVIRYTITNISDEDAWINDDDACFELHKLVDGKWKLVGTKVDHSWTEAALLLPPKESETREIKLEDYYLPLEEGIYRIVVGNIVSNTFKVS
ncbi:MAG: membrane lipoprotein lipid attachment site-containing protein [Clostridia bacterium]|nr:membrane lipoprotein lipid attachment site-containing protein [Clostridia bacterium]